ncbi:Glycosyltransferase [Candidatus Phaeomarinobacter ectocarpi]|uniref:Glycosyltransferase n=1 Tax=Candidatus Phaeomarinibacter ectocarpi TaxID=1458461 RepID=X5MCE0_9HYPH|nr:glycosyltransferase family 4 protein [Candidatus Phaeomarinobacter ectocarpi]CDO59087.1 Glycosyltransferase [Candidatus Phaeomarinobacter ectocarpi]
MAFDPSFLKPGCNIVVAAADVFDRTGGIASVSRSVVDALKQAVPPSGALTVLSLHDGPGTTEGEAATSAEYRFSGFAGSTAGFALALTRVALSADCIVVTHVRLAVPLMLLPKFLRPRLIVLAHGSESWKRLKSSSRRVFRAADLVLTNSRYTLEHVMHAQPGVTAMECLLGLSTHITLQTRLPPPRVGAPLSFQAADGQVRSLGNRMLLIVGRLDPREREKGHMELLQALPALRSHYRDVQLVMAGPGDDSDLYCAMAQDLGVEGAVFVLGRVSNADLIALYRDCYAFVMPSRQEGFGLVYLEAMNWARPCVACHNDGGAEVVADQETGLLIDQPVEVDALADAVLTLLDDPARATSMGAEGWARLQREFTPTQFHARFLSHVRRVLA